MTENTKDTKRSNEDLNLHCDLGFEYNNPIFTQDTPEYDDVSCNQIWQQKEQTSPIDMAETVVMVWSGRCCRHAVLQSSK